MMRAAFRQSALLLSAGDWRHFQKGNRYGKESVQSDREAMLAGLEDLPFRKVQAHHGVRKPFPTLKREQQNVMMLARRKLGLTTVASGGASGNNAAVGTSTAKGS